MLRNIPKRGDLMAEGNYMENMTALFKNLEQVLTAKTVFGEAITVGETTIIPVVDVSFGLGTGGGSGEDKDKGGGSGGGGGAGARMSASAVIVIKGEHVQVMQVKQSTRSEERRGGKECIYGWSPYD